MRKGFVQTDYIIAIGVFLVVFAIVAQYVTNFFADVTQTTDIRLMTSEATSLLSIAQGDYVPGEWPYTTPNSSVIFQLHLDNSTLDSGIYGNNGTISGANCSVSVQGRIGGACEFDGLSHITINDYTLLNGSSEITVGAWIYIVDRTAYDGIIYHYTSNAFGGLSLNDVATETVRFDVKTNRTGYIGLGSGSINVSLNKWHHIVGTYRDGETAKLYVDGRLAGESSVWTGHIWQDDNFKIGWDDASAIRRFNGSIDQVFVYNRSISSEEIYRIYAHESLLKRIGFYSKAYRMKIRVNNTQTHQRNQSAPLGDIASELVVFNYTTFGIVPDVGSTKVYDANDNLVDYSISGNEIRFNFTISENDSKDFTVYFDEDSSFAEQSSSVTGVDNVTDKIYPIDEISIVQFNKFNYLRNANYTLIKNATGLPQDFRISLTDSQTSSLIFEFGPTPPPSGNIVAFRKFVLYQNATASVRKGSITFQVW